MTRMRGTGTSPTVGRSGRSAWARPARYRVRYQSRPAAKATVTRVWSTPMSGHRNERGGRAWSTVPLATAPSMASVRRSSSRSGPGQAHDLGPQGRRGGRGRPAEQVVDRVDGAAEGRAAAPGAGVGDRVDRAGRGGAALAGAAGPGHRGQQPAEGPAPAARASARVRRRQARRTPSTSTAERAGGHRPPPGVPAGVVADQRPARVRALQAGQAGQLDPALAAVGGQPLGHHRLGLEALRQPGPQGLQLAVVVPRRAGRRRRRTPAGRGCRRPPGCGAGRR